MARARVAPRLIDGKLNGRHLIERGTRISGGIYVSTNERLAITVDAASPEVSSIYERMLSWAGNSAPLNRVEQRTFLNVVCIISRQAITTRDQASMEAFEGRFDAGHHEMPLDTFIKMKLGDCRVLSLLAGVLTEKLIDDKFISGKVTIDRNTVEGQGGHAWVRFEDATGRATIIDATNDYVGDEEGGQWVYKRN